MIVNRVMYRLYQLSKQTKKENKNLIHVHFPVDIQ